MKTRRKPATKAQIASAQYIVYRAISKRMRQLQADRDRAIGALLCAAYDGCLTQSRAAELLGMTAVQIRAEAQRIFEKATP